MYIGHGFQQNFNSDRSASEQCDCRIVGYIARQILHVHVGCLFHFDFILDEKKTYLIEIN